MRRAPHHKPINPDIHPIISALRQARIAQSLTLLDLAERSGYGHTTIANMERGNRNPSFTMVSDLAETLGLTLSLQIKSAPDEFNP